MIGYKRCKGTGKAKGHGCGQLVPAKSRHYGLCPNCKKDWMFSTDQGKEFLERIALKHQRIADKKERERIRKQKQRIKSLSRIRKDLQTKVNRLVRMVDNGHPCIATGNFGMLDAGHYISVGANVTISLNFHNIHIQHRESNSFKSGDVINYRRGIVEIYGKEYLDFMDGLQRCKIQLDRATLLKATQRTNEAIREMNKKPPYLLTPKERIVLRNRLNDFIGIYGEWGIYKI